MSQAVFSAGPLGALRDYISEPSKLNAVKPIFSSERMLHKDYYRRSSAEKKNLVVGLKGLDAKTN
jgi:hypothetical protein